MQTFSNFNANQNNVNTNTPYMYTNGAVPVHQQQLQQQQQQSFGPHTIYDITSIRQSLGCPSLNNPQILSMARDAILHGTYMTKLYICNTLCHKFVHQKMIFVLSEGFDVVLTIIWDTKSQNIGNSDTHKSTLHAQYNTNTPTHAAYTTQTTVPLRSHNNIQQTQTETNYHNNNQNNRTEFECMIDEECIDEIVNNLIEADLDDNENNCYNNLPPIPNTMQAMAIEIPETTGNTSITYTHSNYNSPSVQPITATQPRNLRTQTSFYSTNTPTDNTDNFSLNNESVFNDINNININDALWNHINSKLNGHFQSKAELINLISTAIYVKKVPMQRITEHGEPICIFIDSFYVYVTRADQYTVCGVFDYTSYQNNYAQCIQSLFDWSSNNNNNNNNRYKLITNNSKRSIISNNSSCNSSRKSLFNDTTNKKEYHTIYLKPIIERMKSLTAQNNITVDTEYIISIVDNCIKKGIKRQISKRTFEFKWKAYTIVMSKSLKTILDVTLSDNKNIITVHPDVVSIISKKCPVLDYFTIQKLANQAKLTKTFTTKKNDYRQQFIYDFQGCRIVFASNHTTIVEMQSNDPKLLNIN